MKGYSGTPKYTVIMHEVRLSLGLSMTEYCIADTIYKLSTGPKSKVPGWCYASKRTLAEIIGLSEKAIYTILNKLETNKIIERHHKTKNLKTTQKWYDNVVINTNQRLDNQTTVGITKGNKNTNQTTVDDTNQTTVPIYVDNNKLDNNKDISSAEGSSDDEESKKIELEIGKKGNRKKFKELPKEGIGRTIINNLIAPLLDIFYLGTDKKYVPFSIPAHKDIALEIIDLIGINKSLELANFAIDNAGTNFFPMVATIPAMKVKLFELQSWQKRMNSEKKNITKINQGTDFSEQADKEHEKYIRERDERLESLGK